MKACGIDWNWARRALRAAGGNLRLSRPNGGHSETEPSSRQGLAADGSPWPRVHNPCSSLARKLQRLFSVTVRTIVSGVPAGDKRRGHAILVYSVFSVDNSACRKTSCVASSARSGG